MGATVALFAVVAVILAIVWAAFDRREPEQPSERDSTRSPSETGGGTPYDGASPDDFGDGADGASGDGGGD